MSAWHRKLEAIASSVASINMVVHLLAVIISGLFLLYYTITGDPASALITLRLLVASVIVVAFSYAVTHLLKGAVITELDEAMVVTALTWLVVPLSTAFLYIMALELDFVNALFEAMSGFTGTGFSALPRVEGVPYSVLVWRSATQWLGELGTVVVAGVILPYAHRALRQVYLVERGPKLAPTILATVRILFMIYVTCTALGTVMLALSGMDFLDALAHAMTGIATGGMSTKGASIGFWYTRGYTQILYTSSLIMVLGALNFKDLYNLLRGRVKTFAKSAEVKGFFTILLLLAIAMAAVSIVRGLPLAETLYHLISGYTTTGFQVGALHSYPDELKLLLVLGMMIGGATFSTAGGVKTLRVMIAAKSVVWEMARPLQPRGIVFVRRVGSEEVTDEMVISATTYVVLYIALQAVLAVLLHLALVHSSHGGYSALDSLFEVTSALSCVGLSVGIASYTLSAHAKAILMVAMYLGRLEALPLYLIAGCLQRARLK